MLRFKDSLGLAARPNDVLAVGEMLVDFIAEEYEEEATRESAYRPYFGGAPANLAMNAQKLGARAKVAAAVGRDRLGDYLIGRLEAAAMSTELVERVRKATSMVLLTKSQNSPVPIFYRSADHRLSLTPQLAQAVRDSAVLHLSCWPLSRQPSRGTIEAAMRIAAEQGVLIGFDPNYHPALWPEDEDGVAYVRWMIGQADVIKPSDDDAERLFGKDTPDNQLAKFIALGAKLVILTLGREGAIASDGRETLRFPSLATEVADTTGAGDAFWSGFYTSLIQGDTVETAIRLGFAVSAYKLRSIGAVVDLPRLDKIRQMYGL
ncbi:fructokinase [Paenibacillus sp. 598K]|uniref:carbohydrate kinase family protein n=1 Tax=Paenibacillus sp. 598K TaxID=1117987 RepID=UPI000FFA0390|nr:carbohydrate kinase [Paenibacillus sp. 598K]GBF77574.1 fructokinase [Paenibacillus sp. 598K]